MAEKTGSGDPWQPMAGADPTRIGQLGALLKLRRAALGYRHVPAFVRARGINARMVGDIEHGRRDTYTFPTLGDVAAAYEVTCTSMMAVVWSGAGELIPDPPGVPPDLSSPFPARADLNRPWFDPLNERRVRLAARGITDPAGGQMFPDAPDDARAWDGIADSIPVGDKVWIIADLRRRAVERAVERAGNSGTGTTGA